MPDPLLAVDAAWEVWAINDAGERLLAGIKGEPDELDVVIGASLWSTAPGLAGTVAERELRRAMERRDPVTSEFYCERNDRWFHVRASPCRDGLIIAFHDIDGLKRVEALAARLAMKQGAVARIADAVARDAAPQQLFTQVARETAELTGVEAGAVVRFVDDRRIEMVGVHSTYDGTLLPLGVAVDDDGLFTELRRTGETVQGRADAPGPDGQSRQAPGRRGRNAWLQVPIKVHGRLWGAVALTSRRPDVFDREAVERQQRLAELLSVAIANADARERLTRAAETDSVSGLANHRVFHATLREETAKAARAGAPLTIALFDLDRFRDVNDLHGHLEGDRILAEVGTRLRAVIEEGQTLARIGGDKFGLIMPGLRPTAARQVVERARAAIKRAPFGTHGSELTISAGIADVASAGHGELLFACADGALYWAKLNGRDMVFTYEPSIVNELSPTDRAETLLRRKTLAGITALARAIDAKDPSTRQHSERVADLVEQLARARGWEERRIRLLREAGLVHDVGKIGVPDAILLQSGRLTPEQYEIVKRHAQLGADIVRDVLTPEQVSWIRSHHERPDGRGYPDGLAGDEIPPGAALLSIADALDVMTVGRPYSRPMPLDDAVEECTKLVGTQFTPEAVSALRTLHRAGALDAWELRD